MVKITDWETHLQAIIVEAKSKKNAADAKLDEAIRVLQKAKDILKNIKFPVSECNNRTEAVKIFYE